jgi:hypothetical protein
VGARVPRAHRVLAAALTAPDELRQLDGHRRFAPGTVPRIAPGPLPTTGTPRKSATGSLQVIRPGAVWTLPVARAAIRSCLIQTARLEWPSTNVATRGAYRDLLHVAGLDMLLADSSKSMEACR